MEEDYSYLEEQCMHGLLLGRKSKAEGLVDLRVVVLLHHLGMIISVILWYFFTNLIFCTKIMSDLGWDYGDVADADDGVSFPP